MDNENKKDDIKSNDEKHPGVLEANYLELKQRLINEHL